MDTLFYLEIPMFYHAYARDVYRGTTGVHKGQSDPTYAVDTRYYCSNCNTNFKVEHRSMPMSYGFNDTIVRCPVCGVWLYNLGHFQSIARLSAEDDSDAAPIRMTLRLTESKDAVTLHVWAKVVQMDTDRRTFVTTRQERFKFDVRHRRTTFTYMEQDENGHLHRTSTTIDSLCDDTMFSKSLLKHIHSRNLVFNRHRYHDEPEFALQDKKRRKDIYKLMRILRETVQHKWKEIYGYPLASLFVSYGQVHGLLLFPLRNIAWRLMYPDAGNLPKEFSGESYCIRSYLKKRCFNMDLIQKYRQNPYNKKRISSVQAIIHQLQLPDIPFVRQQLSKDLLAGPVLLQAFSVIRNPDYVRQLLQYLKWPDDAGFTPAGFPVVQKALQYWSPRTLFPALRRGRTPMYLLRDILQMMGMMHGDNLEQAKKVPFRKVHDWLVNKVQEFEEKGFSLEVPDDVRRRLTIQLDNGYLQFFLPQHSHDLIDASKIFHNCVRTYSERVLRRECQIVLMTNDNGLMKACLEIRGNALVQAKLKFNKPVSADAVVNSAVIDWCRSTGLVIRTTDVRQLHYLVPITERRAV